MAKRRAKGEGSIYYDEVNNRWMAQITLPNGKRRTKSGASQKAVRDWLTKQRHNISEGLYVLDDKVKFGEFLDRYMKDVALHNLRATTYQTHAGLIKNHIQPELGNIRLSSLSATHIQRFYTKKLESGLSKRTVQYLHTIIHRVLNQALRWGLVARNVSDLVDAPSPKRRPPATWSISQVKKFLSAVEDHRWYPIYVIACYCGLRKGEILGIYKEDVDIENGVIHVRHAVQEVTGRGLMITEPKTEKAKRPVNIPSTALQVLRGYLEGVEANQLIFTTSSGKPISPRNVVRHFKSVIKATGLPDIRFHDLRHTHASLLLEAGVHPKVVQERLGHSQISLTLDTYSHTIPSMQEDAAEKFETLLS
jgi:integrase